MDGKKNDASASAARGSAAAETPEETQRDSKRVKTFSRLPVPVSNPVFANSAEINAEIADLKTQLAEAQQKIEQHQRDKETLKASFQQQLDIAFQKNNEAHAEKVEKLNAKLRALKSENNALTDDKEALIAQVTTLEEQKENIETSLVNDASENERRLQNEIEALKKQFATANATILERQKKAGELHQANEQLKEQIAALESQRDKANADKLAFQQKATGLANENEQLKEQIAALESQRDKANADKLAFQQEVTRLAQENYALQTSNAAAANTMETVEDATVQPTNGEEGTQRLRNQLAIAVENTQRLSQQVEALKVENQQLQQQLSQGGGGGDALADNDNQQLYAVLQALLNTVSGFDNNAPLTVHDAEWLKSAMTTLIDAARLWANPQALQAYAQLTAWCHNLIETYEIQRDALLSAVTQGTLPAKNALQAMRLTTDQTILSNALYQHVQNADDPVQIVLAEHPLELQTNLAALITDMRESNAALLQSVSTTSVNLAVAPRHATLNEAHLTAARHWLTTLRTAQASLIAACNQGGTLDNVQDMVTALAQSVFVPAVDANGNAQPLDAAAQGRITFMTERMRKLVSATNRLHTLHNSTFPTYRQDAWHGVDYDATLTAVETVVGDANAASVILRNNQIQFEPLDTTIGSLLNTFPQQVALANVLVQVKERFETVLETLNSTNEVDRASFAEFVNETAARVETAAVLVDALASLGENPRVGTPAMLAADVVPLAVRARAMTNNPVNARVDQPTWFVRTADALLDLDVAGDAKPLRDETRQWLAQADTLLLRDPEALPWVAAWTTDCMLAALEDPQITGALALSAAYTACARLRDEAAQIAAGARNAAGDLQVRLLTNTAQQPPPPQEDRVDAVAAAAAAEADEAAADNNAAPMQGVQDANTRRTILHKNTQRVWDTLPRLALPFVVHKVGDGTVGAAALPATTNADWTPWNEALDDERAWSTYTGLIKRANVQKTMAFDLQRLLREPPHIAAKTLAAILERQRTLLLGEDTDASDGLAFLITTVTTLASRAVGQWLPRIAALYTGKSMNAFAFASGIADPDAVRTAQNNNTVLALLQALHHAELDPITLTDALMSDVLSLLEALPSAGALATDTVVQAIEIRHRQAREEAEETLREREVRLALLDYILNAIDAGQRDNNFDLKTNSDAAFQSQNLGNEDPSRQFVEALIEDILATEDNHSRARVRYRLATARAFTFKDIALYTTAAAQLQRAIEGLSAQGPQRVDQSDDTPSRALANFLQLPVQIGATRRTVSTWLGLDDTTLALGIGGLRAFSATFESSAASSADAVLSAIDEAARASGNDDTALRAASGIGVLQRARKASDQLAQLAVALLPPTEDADGNAVAERVSVPISDNMFDEFKRVASLVRPLIAALDEAAERVAAFDGGMRMADFGDNATVRMHTALRGAMAGGINADDNDEQLLNRIARTSTTILRVLMERFANMYNFATALDVEFDALALLAGGALRELHLWHQNRFDPLARTLKARAVCNGAVALAMRRHQDAPLRNVEAAFARGGMDTWLDAAVWCRAARTDVARLQKTPTNGARWRLSMGAEVLGGHVTDMLRALLVAGDREDNGRELDALWGPVAEAVGALPALLLSIDRNAVGGGAELFAALNERATTNTHAWADTMLLTAVYTTMRVVAGANGAVNTFEGDPTPSVMLSQTLGALLDGPAANAACASSEALTRAVRRYLDNGVEAQRIDNGGGAMLHPLPAFLQELSNQDVALGQRLGNLQTALTNTVVISTRRAHGQQRLFRELAENILPTTLAATAPLMRLAPRDLDTVNRVYDAVDNATDNRAAARLAALVRLAGRLTALPARIEDTVDGLVTALGDLVWDDTVDAAPAVIPKLHDATERAGLLARHALGADIIARVTAGNNNDNARPLLATMADAQGIVPHLVTAARAAAREALGQQAAVAVADARNVDTLLDAALTVGVAMEGRTDDAPALGDALAQLVATPLNNADEALPLLEAVLRERTDTGAALRDQVDATGEFLLALHGRQRQRPELAGNALVDALQAFAQLARVEPYNRPVSAATDVLNVLNVPRAALVRVLPAYGAALSVFETQLMPRIAEANRIMATLLPDPLTPDDTDVDGLRRVLDDLFTRIPPDHHARVRNDNDNDNNDAVGRYFEGPGADAYIRELAEALGDTDVARPIVPRSERDRALAFVEGDAPQLPLPNLGVLVNAVRTGHAGFAGALTFASDVLGAMIQQNTPAMTLAQSVLRLLAETYNRHRAQRDADANRMAHLAHRLHVTVDHLQTAQNGDEVAFLTEAQAVLRDQRVPAGPALGAMHLRRRDVRAALGTPLFPPRGAAIKTAPDTRARCNFAVDAVLFSESPHHALRAFALVALAPGTGPESELPRADAWEQLLTRAPLVAAPILALAVLLVDVSSDVRDVIFGVRPDARDAHAALARRITATRTLAAAEVRAQYCRYTSIADCSDLLDLVQQNNPDDTVPLYVDACKVFASLLLNERLQQDEVRDPLTDDDVARPFRALQAVAWREALPPISRGAFPDTDDDVDAFDLVFDPRNGERAQNAAAEVYGAESAIAVRLLAGAAVVALDLAQQLRVDARGIAPVPLCAVASRDAMDVAPVAAGVRATTHHALTVLMRANVQHASLGVREALAALPDADTIDAATGDTRARLALAQLSAMLAHRMRLAHANTALARRPLLPAWAGTGSAQNGTDATATVRVFGTELAAAPAAARWLTLTATLLGVDLAHTRVIDADWLALPAPWHDALWARCVVTLATTDAHAAPAQFSRWVLAANRIVQLDPASEAAGKRASARLAELVRLQHFDTTLPEKHPAAMAPDLADALVTSRALGQPDTTHPLLTLLRTPAVAVEPDNGRWWTRARPHARSINAPAAANPGQDPWRTVAGIFLRADSDGDVAPLVARTGTAVHPRTRDESERLIATTVLPWLAMAPDGVVAARLADTLHAAADKRALVPLPAPDTTPRGQMLANKMHTLRTDVQQLLPQTPAVPTTVALPHAQVLLAAFLEKVPPGGMPPALPLPALRRDAARLAAFLAVLEAHTGTTSADAAIAAVTRGVGMMSVPHDGVPAGLSDAALLPLLAAHDADGAIAGEAVRALAAWRAGTRDTEDVGATLARVFATANVPAALRRRLAHTHVAMPVVALSLE